MVLSTCTVWDPHTGTSGTVYLLSCSKSPSWLREVRSYMSPQEQVKDSHGMGLGYLSVTHANIRVSTTKACGHPLPTFVLKSLWPSYHDFCQSPLHKASESWEICSTSETHFPCLQQRKWHVLWKLLSYRKIFLDESKRKKKIHK